MNLLSSLTLIIWQIALSNGACFTPEASSTVKKPIYMFLKDTQRECERQCEANAQCVSIKYNLTSKACVLQKAEDLSTCSGSYTRYVRDDTCAAAKRTDPMAEMGTDPCVTKYRPEFTYFSTPNVCQVRNLNGSDGPLLALRGVLENGTRVTLSDENAATVSYEASTDTWVYEINNDDTSLQIRLHAVICAEFDNSKCPCSPLPYPNLSKPYTPVKINMTRPCPSLSWTDVKYLYKIVELGYSDSEIIVCKAGAWFLSYIPERRAAQITNAGCT